jgi:hypothetical protein
LELPILCTLTESELAERKKVIYDSIAGDILATHSLPEGFAFEFAASHDLVVSLARLVGLEHQCCRFLSFKITVPAGEGPVLLEVTGPPTAKSLIADFLAPLAACLPERPIPRSGCNLSD